MTQTKDWTFTDFGEEFDEHVARHLPGYADVQRLVGLVATSVVPDGGVVADLGCSTGATVQWIVNALDERSVDTYLYDLDASMLTAASKRLVPLLAHHRFTFSANRRDLRIGPLCHDNADLTLMLWLLQFIHPRDWVGVLSHAARHARPGGTLLLAAKTTHADPEFQRIAVAALDDYKAEAGVQAQERADKTKALRGVLHEGDMDDYVVSMNRAGWQDVTVLWRWHVWTVFAAHAR